MVRYKNRYIVAEINPENQVKYNDFAVQELALNTAIKNKVQQLYGDFGTAAICNGFVVKYCNKYLRTVLMRVRHGPHRFITSSLPFVDKISDRKVSINLLYVGATMTHCFKFLLRYHKNQSVRELQPLKAYPEYVRWYKLYTALKIDTT